MIPPKDGTELVTLGIATSHDSGVAILRGDRILAAINEERVSRVKAAAGFPHRALEEIWAVAGVTPQEVDAVGFAGYSLAPPPPTNNDFSRADGSIAPSQQAAELLDRIPVLRHAQASLGFRRLHLESRHLLGRRRLKEVVDRLSQIGCMAPIRVFDHHDAHLAGAYYTSGEDECLLVTNDGFGDGLCSKVAVARSGEFHTTVQNTFFNSVGNYYNYVTNFCGFKKEHHAGKTTGLAAFGDASRTIDYFRKKIVWDPSRGVYLNRGGIFRNALLEISNVFRGVPREDVAAGIQKHLEEIITLYVAHHVNATGMRKVAVAGGVHANVRINQRISEIRGVERLAIFPHMGDGGLALGAAYLAIRDACPGWLRPRRLETVYFGHEFSESDCELALRSAGRRFSRPQNMAQEVARLLARNSIVARHHGRMEYGPRSLGNRSILYPATDRSVNLWLNKQLHRTEFMPFAPVVRDVDAIKCFPGLSDVNRYPAEFMTIALEASDVCKAEAPATVHVDGSARPQVLRREQNAGYYDILTEYEKLTGLSILVNTSFNMHEEPIVCSPAQAIAAFESSSLHALILGPFLVEAGPSV